MADHTRYDLLSPTHLEQMNQLRDGLMRNVNFEPGDLESLSFYALAFAGEAGELANVVKKMIRDGYSEELHLKLVNEIADCIIYLQHLCDDQDINPGLCVDSKIQELRRRWSQFFSPDGN